MADTIIAKLTKSDDNDKSSQTGDNSNLALLLALIILSGSALIGTGIYGRKKKHFVK